jgi:hypothetical protein
MHIAGHYSFAIQGLGTNEKLKRRLPCLNEYYGHDLMNKEVFHHGGRYSFALDSSYETISDPHDQ